MARRRDRDARDARESSLAKGWVVEASEDADEAAPPAVAEGSIASAESASEAEPAADRAATESAQLSNGAMVLLGVIGGLYLAYTWIWFSWAQYFATVSGTGLSVTSGSAGAVLQLVLYWLAPVAPALWFVSALLLNRGEQVWKLALWLGIGAVLLVPLPFVMWGA